MIELIIINNQFTFRGYLFHFVKWNKIDVLNFECETPENIFNFVYGETKINGTIPLNWTELNNIPTI